MISFKSRKQKDIQENFFFFETGKIFNKQFRETRCCFFLEIKDTQNLNRKFNFKGIRKKLIVIVKKLKWERRTDVFYSFICLRRF